MIRVGMESEASHDHSMCSRLCGFNVFSIYRTVLTSDYASLLALEFNRNPVINDEAAFDIYAP